MMRMRIAAISEAERASSQEKAAAARQHVLQLLRQTGGPTRPMQRRQPGSPDLCSIVAQNGTPNHGQHNHLFKGDAVRR